MKDELVLVVEYKYCLSRGWGISLSIVAVQPSVQTGYYQFSALSQTMMRTSSVNIPLEREWTRKDYSFGKIAQLCALFCSVLLTL